MWMNYSGTADVRTLHRTVITVLICSFHLAWSTIIPQGNYVLLEYLLSSLEAIMAALWTLVFIMFTIILYKAAQRSLDPLMTLLFCEASQKWLQREP